MYIDEVGERKLIKLSHKTNIKSEFNKQNDNGHLEENIENIEMSKELVGCRLIKLVRVDWSNFHIK